MQAHYEPPYGLKSKPERTLFVARLGSNITKYDLKEFFSKYGEVVSAKVIVDVVTGLSQGYGFVEMKSEDEARRVIRRCVDVRLKRHQIFIDYECGRTLQGWKPRRLGGGFGGKKGSGQLRFGGRDRPFKKPIIPNIIRSNPHHQEYHHQEHHHHEEHHHHQEQHYYQEQHHHQEHHHPQEQYYYQEHYRHHYH
ncbi:U11/U12 small nuclear ribonucleoprotein 35 kDa protein [Melipona quadrifasciata]|uniref:U11/U12 small nuclear ribonucleoprotein 35 kDa protein n=1 Tax=Melipona quadrifasciata TaxID=166423 RepID=A0A0N0BHS0_9HYME|nr:U11/U12 small nuclear ribonucleoprotein 35 kDa protein [Melipona quadrifasciata]